MTRKVIQKLLQIEGITGNHDGNVSLEQAVAHLRPDMVTAGASEGSYTGAVAAMGAAASTGAEAAAGAAAGA